VGGGPLAAALDSLDLQAVAFETGARPPAPEGGGGGGGGGGPRVEENLTRLNGELVDLYGVIEGADAAPTTQGTARVRELERALAERLARWRELAARFRSVTRGLQ